MSTYRSICWTALPLLFCAPGMALAQEQAAPVEAPSADQPAPVAADADSPIVADDPLVTDGEDQVRFSADRL